MNVLPKFIRYKIFEYLDLEDLVSLSLTNKALYNYVSDENYWKLKLEKDFGMETKEMESGKFKGAYLQLYYIPFFPDKNKELTTIQVERYRINKLSGNWLTACGCTPYTRGKIYVEMRVNNSGGLAVCLGVSAYFREIEFVSKNVSYDELCVSYNPYSKSCWHKGKKVSPQIVPPFDEKNIFGIYIDFEETKSVYFLMNGKFFTKALKFKGSFRFYPTISFGNNSEVEFVRPAHTPVLTKEFKEMKPLWKFTSEHQSLAEEKHTTNPAPFFKYLPKKIPNSTNLTIHTNPNKKNKKCVLN